MLSTYIFKMWVLGVLHIPPSVIHIIHYDVLPESLSLQLQPWTVCIEAMCDGAGKTKEKLKYHYLPLGHIPITKSIHGGVTACT